MGETRERAFRARVRGRDGTTGIYTAATASKARYKAYLAAHDVGLDVPLTEIQVHRAPKYDGLGFRSLTIEHAEQVRRAARHRGPEVHT